MVGIVWSPAELWSWLVTRYFLLFDATVQVNMLPAVPLNQFPASFAEQHSRIRDNTRIAAALLANNSDSSDLLPIDPALVAHHPVARGLKMGQTILSDVDHPYREEFAEALLVLVTTVARQSEYMRRILERRTSSLEDRLAVPWPRRLFGERKDIPLDTGSGTPYRRQRRAMGLLPGTLVVDSWVQAGDGDIATFAVRTLLDLERTHRILPGVLKPRRSTNHALLPGQPLSGKGLVSFLAGREQRSSDASAADLISELQLTEESLWKEASTIVQKAYREERQSRKGYRSRASFHLQSISIPSLSTAASSTHASVDSLPESCKFLMLYNHSPAAPREQPHRGTEIPEPTTNNNSSSPPTTSPLTTTPVEEEDFVSMVLSGRIRTDFDTQFTNIDESPPISPPTPLLISARDTVSELNVPHDEPRNDPRITYAPPHVSSTSRLTTKWEHDYVNALKRPGKRLWRKTRNAVRILARTRRLHALQGCDCSQPDDNKDTHTHTHNGNAHTLTHVTLPPISLRAPATLLTHAEEDIHDDEEEEEENDPISSYYIPGIDHERSGDGDDIDGDNDGDDIDIDARGLASHPIAQQSSEEWEGEADILPHTVYQSHSSDIDWRAVPYER